MTRRWVKWHGRVRPRGTPARLRVRPVIQIKISRFTFLEKRKSRDFFTHPNQKSQEFLGSPRKFFL